MRRHALILAANRFEDPAVSPLRYAEADARLLEGFLRETAGFEKVVGLYGPELQKDLALETARNLAQELAVAGGGLLKLFYAGHGVSLRGRHLLLCPRVYLESLDAEDYDHALGVERLAKETACPGVVRVFVVDACRASLHAGLRGGRIEGYQTAGLREISATRVKREDGGWVTICACSEGEQAQELETLEHGLFCYSYVEELRAAARAGQPLRLDDVFVESVAARMWRLSRHGQFAVQQRPWVRSNCDAPVLLEAAGRSWSVGSALPRDLELEALGAPCAPADCEAALGPVGAAPSERQMGAAQPSGPSAPCPAKALLSLPEPQCGNVSRPGSLTPGVAAAGSQPPKAEDRSFGWGRQLLLLLAFLLIALICGWDFTVRMQLNKVQAALSTPGSAGIANLEMGPAPPPWLRQRHAGLQRELRKCRAPLATETRAAGTATNAVGMTNSGRANPSLESSSQP